MILVLDKQPTDPLGQRDWTRFMEHKKGCRPSLASLPTNRQNRQPRGAMVGAFLHAAFEGGDARYRDKPFVVYLKASP